MADPYHVVDVVLTTSCLWFRLRTGNNYVIYSGLTTLEWDTPPQIIFANLYTLPPESNANSSASASSSAPGRRPKQ